MSKLPYSLELTSHPLCPFLQRWVMILLKKELQAGTDFTVRYVDLAKIAPSQRAPELRVNNSHQFHDVIAVAALLDELTASHSMLPSDPLKRTMDREAILQATSCFEVLRKVFTTKDPIVLTEAITQVFDQLRQIEAWADPNDRFSLVDATYAPAFCVMSPHALLWQDQHWKELPKTRAWAENLLKDHAVQGSKCDAIDRSRNYANEFKKFFDFFGSSFPNLQLT